MRKKGNQTKSRSRNRSVNCSGQEIFEIGRELVSMMSEISLKKIANKIIHQDIFEAAPYLPIWFVDLLVLDPPYNLDKNYNGYLFKAKEQSEYQEWFARWIKLVKPMLKPTATV